MYFSGGGCGDVGKKLNACLLDAVKTDTEETCDEHIMDIGRFDLKTRHLQLFGDLKTGKSDYESRNPINTLVGLPICMQVFHEHDGRHRFSAAENRSRLEKRN